MVSYPFFEVLAYRYAIEGLTGYGLLRAESIYIYFAMITAVGVFNEV